MLQEKQSTKRLKIKAAIAVFALLPLASFATQHRSHRAIAEFKREQPCPANGKRYGPCHGYQIDHVIPLKCRGDDLPSNMQWLTIEQHKEKTAREAKWCRSKAWEANPATYTDGGEP